MEHIPCARHIPGVLLFLIPLWLSYFCYPPLQVDKYKHEELKNIPEVIMQHLTFIDLFFYAYVSSYGSHTVGIVCVLLTNIFPSPSLWRK